MDASLKRPMKHKRHFQPIPDAAGMLRGSCGCGWSCAIDVTRHSKLMDASDALEDAFVAHIPKTDRSVALFVNAFPGQERISLMPEDEPVIPKQWAEIDGIRHGELEDGRWLPATHIILVDGRVLKSED